MRIIGLMSGTSLDGLDIAYCHFQNEPGQALRMQLLAAETIPYPTSWVERLARLEHATAIEYALADVELGHYFGEQVCRFRERHPGHVDAVASHGHTIFHQPHRRLTTQIGEGEAIAAACGLPVVFRFRNLDVALGGQGAPLVPIGDQMLFGQYHACLNLGGIANISFSHPSGHRIAYDICVCNMLLNSLAQRAGKTFDHDGAMASAGTVIEPLLDQMEQLEYYSQRPPKSLGKEWFVQNIVPLVSADAAPTTHLMRTAVEHIATRLAHDITRSGITSILVTGGGARNKFLMRRVEELLPQCTIHYGDDNITDYKEAIIFALLGHLRLNGLDNCLCSVTGAVRDSCGGAVVNPC